MELKRVVVTGLGAITPVGNGVPEFWENLVNGVSGAGPITHFDAHLFKTQFACEVKNFDATRYIDRKEARKMDLYTQYAIAVAKEAVSDSGLDTEKEDLNRIGVIFGAGIGGIRTFEEEAGNYAKTGQEMGPKFSPFFIPKMISDIAAGYISMKYGFMGPNFCTVSACASSNHAIIIAADQIRLGRADIMITGGSEAPVNQPSVGGFNSMQALSTRNDDPATASRPYDCDRDGFVIGEGAGGLILEEYEHAKARGAKIYAEVGGGGVSADAYHFTAPHPEGLGAKQAILDAMKEAEVTADEIDYINTHGTSTPAGDLPELTGIQGAIGDRIYKANLSSTKSMTGHLLGAAGAVEALACIMAITEGIIPPTINNFNRDPKIDERINLTLNTAQERDVRVAISNTFGFGGHNATVLLKKI